MKHIFNEVHYELTRKIAEGGMGLVYEATQRGIGGFRKVVAIKLIREEYSAIEEFRNNFIGGQIGRRPDPYQYCSNLPPG